jgi:glycosyltransferase involved in cell wall biosynthesis
LIDGYLRPYARAFERVWYWSYLPEAIDDYVDDPELRRSVRVLAPRDQGDRLVRAAMIPLRHRRELRRVAVLRVFQLTGVVPALIARACWGTPFVTTYGFWYTRLSRPGPSRVGKRLLERVGLRRAAAVIVTTEELRAHVATLTAPDRVHLIPNGVDLARFAPGARAGRRCRRVVYVGRLSAEKNLFSLVRAVAAMKARVPAELVLIGAGPLRDQLADEARAAGVHAEFPGVVEHQVVPDWLRQADAFVLPSFTEGHPKVLLEAMAVGVPCVASDCSGNRALVRDGETGLLFDARDPGALAARLERVLTDARLAVALGRRGREAVARDYDLARLVEAEIALLKRVAQNDGGRSGR